MENPTPPKAPSEFILTTKDVAKTLNVSLVQAYTLINEGKIPAHRFGRACIRVTEKDLFDFIKNSAI